MTTVEKKAVSHLVEHELALKVYLDSLLFEDAVTETDTVVTAEPVISPIVEDVELKTLPEEAEQAEATVELALDIATNSPEAGRPDWSDSTFECLMFKVAGSLTLSVPLTRLNGILPWEGDVTPVPGYAEWFLGLLQNRGRQVKVIDIAKFVIPQNHKARESLVKEREFKHIVLIDGGKFGLACDGLGDVLKLNKEQVRWRSDRSHRPWLAGTVIDHMSALIDIDQFIVMLKDDGVPDDIS